MSDPGSEDERLAAFLDGRLDERERAEMLARLAADDDAYEVFAGLAGILRQAEEEDAAVGALADEGGASPPTGARAPADEPVHEGVIALEERARAPASVEHGRAARSAKKRASIVGWMALAAVLAGVALIPALRRRTSADPVRLAARLEHGGEGLPAGWTERPPWSSPRGDAPAGGASPPERAARAGALLVDLSVAVRARDAAGTRRLAAQVASRFDPQGGRGGPLRTIRDGAGSPAQRLQPSLAQATDRIAKRLGRRDALQLGAWTEAARLAAATHDAAFFRDRMTHSMLDRAARLTASDPPASAAVERVGRLLAGAAPPRWDALTDALDVLAREIASG